MSQSDFGTITASTKSGTQLAADLNAWRTALHSSHSGASRPSYAIAGTQWADTTTAADPLLYYYTGSADIPIFQVDGSDGVARFGFSGDEGTYWKPGATSGMFLFDDGVEVLDLRDTSTEWYNGAHAITPAGAAFGTTTLEATVLTVKALSASGNLALVADGVASGNTNAHQMRMRWTSNYEEFYIFPRDDGTNAFSSRQFYDFVRSEWGFGTPLQLRNGSVPSSSPVDGVVLYPQDVTGSSELRVRDEAGNVTTLSNHSRQMLPPPAELMAMSYRSEKWGEDAQGLPVLLDVVEVALLELYREVERLSGKKFVYLKSEMNP